MATGILALVPDDWTSIVTTRHQILGRLAQKFPVVWMDPARPWREFLQPRHARRGGIWKQPLSGLHVMRAGWRHPQIYRPAWLRQAILRSRLRIAASRLRNLGARRIALYLWRDEFAPALDLIEHDFSCYHIDDEYSFESSEQPVSEREAALIRRVNQVIVHSPALQQKKGGINPRTALIPNGVDFQGYSSATEAPADLAGIAHPIIGYSGVIKRQLDFDLLCEIAAARPQYSLVLVGPVTNVSGKERQLATLRQMPNVHFLGHKDADLLPAYVQRFDVALMCYELNAYTRYIYPLKLHEYLATGRPVVSAEINTVVETRAPVSLAAGTAEWLAAIDANLLPAANSPESRDERQAVARSHDWNILTDQVAALFKGSRDA